MQNIIKFIDKILFIRISIVSCCTALKPSKYFLIKRSLHKRVDY